MNAKALTIYLGFYMHRIYLLQQKCTNPKKGEAFENLKYDSYCLFVNFK